MAKENRRSISENEKHRESAALDAIHSFICEMTPYQLELLADYAWKITSGKFLSDK